MAQPQTVTLIGPRRTRLTFANVGDTLSMHTHGERDAHITIVARGSFEMTIGKMVDGAIVREPSQTVSAGQEIDTPAGIYHEFVALADGARLYNIPKRA